MHVFLSVLAWFACIVVGTALLIARLDVPLF